MIGSPSRGRYASCEVYLSEDYSLVVQKSQLFLPTRMNYETAEASFDFTAPATTTELTGMLSLHFVENEDVDPDNDIELLPLRVTP